MIRILAAGLTVFLLFFQSVYAQDTFDPDDLFKEARTLGFDGKREDARRLLLRILEKYPDYTDVRVFLGRLHSWDGQYDDARAALQEALKRSAASKDARSALVDVELWSDHPQQALEVSDAGLLAEPGDETLLYKKAQALSKLNRSKEAAVLLERVLARNPSYSEARSLLTSLKEGRRLYRFSTDYGHQRVTNLDPWHESSASLSREMSRGSIIGRMNYANRFGSNVAQAEVDAYPGLHRGLYAYVSYGYSWTDLYPKHRGGVELFANPGKGLELSAGFRYLYFGSDVWIYTGTVGKYFGNYFVSVRPFVTPGTTGSSVSASGSLRRYFGDTDTYLALSIGGGSAPNDALSTVDLGRLNSFKIGGSGSVPLGGGSYLKFNAGWDAEQMSATLERNRISMGAGFTKRF